ncbi:GDSL-type esterase/lipase family protein [Cohnella cellulosilytica]|uniref:GDSL-type esterase/lipase family protein n=1 Tax=Cohnella cellulosilytica TaxID=986710 RepID=A0ABW2FKK9_9BACL
MTDGWQFRKTFADYKLREGLRRFGRKLNVGDGWSGGADGVSGGVSSGGSDSLSNGVTSDGYGDLLNGATSSGCDGSSNGVTSSEFGGSSDNVASGGPDGSSNGVSSGSPNSAPTSGIDRVCNVAFIGGSVTDGAGASDPGRTSWRSLTCRYLAEKYPHVSFRFTNAAVGGTDSTYGAFRFRQDVPQAGAVDLLLVEYAVNDARNRDESVRAMEGIVRQALRANPEVDIVFVYTTHQSGVERWLKEGEADANIGSHEEVADYYGLPSVDFSREVAKAIGAGLFDWGAFSEDNVHPRDFGHALYAELIQKFLEAAAADWSNSQPSAASDGAAAGTRFRPPLDPQCYEHGRLVGIDAAEIAAGWKQEREFAPDSAQICNWTPPAEILLGDAPGDSLVLSFEGTNIGFVMLAGPDTGAVDISIDEGSAFAYDPFDRYCKMFYRPKIWLLSERLEPGRHTIRISIADRKHEESLGKRLHLWKFMVN